MHKIGWAEPFCISLAQLQTQQHSNLPDFCWLTRKSKSTAMTKKATGRRCTELCTLGILLLRASTGASSRSLLSDDRLTDSETPLLSNRVLLLQRSDTDMFLKDYEGYTPFDLYNSTVNGTNPPTVITGRPMADLYTWGSNRNATLGLGDSDDRSMPEQVVIRCPERQRTTSNLYESLKTVSVADIAMSKLHTVVITTEGKGNIRSCGFAGSGRLGPGATTSSHTQFSLLSPQGSFPHTITAVALGQDHTLALTSIGEVLSWGLNRFSQLGYIIEAKSRAQEDQIQASPRKITGPLRNQIVIGVACCKTASACWTATQLFTWGTNGGQLGSCISVMQCNKVS
jgi:alpha-tubulin suppressor-like RCC1 family protein